MDRGKRGETGGWLFDLSSFSRQQHTTCAEIDGQKHQVMRQALLRGQSAAQSKFYDVNCF
jgi:hypothetical protein